MKSGETVRLRVLGKISTRFHNLTCFNKPIVELLCIEAGSIGDNMVVEYRRLEGEPKLQALYGSHNIRHGLAGHCSTWTRWYGKAFHGGRIVQLSSALQVDSTRGVCNHYLIQSKPPLCRLRSIFPNGEKFDLMGAVSTSSAPVRITRESANCR